MYIQNIQNIQNMSSITFNNVNVFLVDGNDSYNIMDLLISKETNSMIIADIVNELSKIFKKDCYVSGTLAYFYENLPYKLFNYIFIKDFDGDLKKIKNNNTYLVLVYKDKKLTINFDTDLTFGLSLGFFLAHVQNDL